MKLGLSSGVGVDAEGTRCPFSAPGFKRQSAPPAELKHDQRSKSGNHTSFSIRIRSAGFEYQLSENIMAAMTSD